MSESEIDRALDLDGVPVAAQGERVDLATDTSRHDGGKLEAPAARTTERLRSITRAPAGVIAKMETFLDKHRPAARARQIEAGARGAAHGVKGATHGVKGGRGKKAETPLGAPGRQGGFRDGSKTRAPKSAETAAKETGTSTRTLERTLAVTSKGTPELVAEVQAGELTPLILDGRNRLRAAYEACVKPSFREYEGDDPVGFVLSLNLTRRHLSESQRANVAARIATLTDGHRQVGKFADVPTQAEAAKLLNVSERQVRSARAVQRTALPEIVEAVDRGEVSLGAAAEVARLPVDEQRVIAAEGPKAVKAKAAEIREEPHASD